MENEKIIEQIKQKQALAAEKAKNRPLWFKVGKWTLWLLWAVVVAAFMLCVCFPIILCLSIITGGRVTTLGLDMAILAPKGRISKF